MKYREVSISEICQLFNLEYIGNNVIINGLNLCNRKSAYSSILGYTTSELFFDSIFMNQSVCALILTKENYDILKNRKELTNRRMAYILSNEPEILFYKIHNYLCREGVFYQDNIEKSIGDHCTIHPTVVIEDGVIIHDRVEIGPYSVIKKGTEIGDDTYIGCHTIIGEDGFQGIHGFKGHIYHAGGVSIGKGVSIGNNTCICRSLFEGVTMIKDYCKIDNLVNISHNCVCGVFSTICVGSILMGSSYVEDNAYLAPGAMLLNQKVVGKDAFVGSMSYVNKSVKPGSQVFGIPAKKLPQL